jgi:hypothetical protein
MVSRMAAFLLRLAEDSEAFAEFKRDPDASMSDAGLSDEERSALMSNDGDRIRQAVASSIDEPQVMMLPDKIMITITIHFLWP